MDLLSEAARLERLANDLRLLHGNGGQAPITRLEHAPTLRNWRLIKIPVPVFAGVVEGHPRLGDGCQIRTSQVWARGDGWIRTLSRFYLLSGSAED